MLIVQNVLSNFLAGQFPYKYSCIVVLAIYIVVNPSLYMGLYGLRQNWRNTNKLVASTYGNMALVYNEQGKYALALEFYEMSLAITKQCMGENHLEVALTYGNMGTSMVYQVQGKYA